MLTQDNYILFHLILDVLCLGALLYFYFKRHWLMCSLLLFFVVVQYFLPYLGDSGLNPFHTTRVTSKEQTEYDMQSGKLAFTADAANPLEGVQQVTGMYEYIINKLRHSIGKKNLEIDVPGIDQYNQSKEYILDIMATERGGWLLLRTLLLFAAAAVYFFMSKISAICFIFSIIPLPFLMNLTDRLHSALRGSEFATQLVEKYPQAAVIQHPFYLPAFFLCTLGTTLVLILLFKLAHSDHHKRTLMRRCMNPSRYGIRIGEDVWEFEVEGSHIIMGDARINMEDVYYDPNHPNHIRLPSGEAYEFVPVRKSKSIFE